MLRHCLLLIVLVSITCSPPPPAELAPKSAEYVKHATDDAFLLYMTQGARSVRVGNGQQVTIRKEPFSFVFVSRDLDGYLVNLSRSRTSLDELLAGKECEGIDGLSGGSGMAERLGNPDREAGIAQQSSNYWYYGGEEQSRFDTHKLVDSIHVLTRVVENLSYVDEGGVLPVGQFDADTLYVSIITRRKDSLTYDWQVHQRLGYTLTFGDTVAVSGDTVTIPEPVEPPVEEQDAATQAEKETDTKEIAFVVPDKPADDECFVLIGMGADHDTVYKQSICPDQLRQTDDGYRAEFASLVPDALYSLLVLFHNGRSYHLFERKRLSEL